MFYVCEHYVKLLVTSGQATFPKAWTLVVHNDHIVENEHLPENDRGWDMRAPNPFMR